jgi:hypothetical protein
MRSLPLIKNTAECNGIVDEYLEKTITKQSMPTKAGLCLALGFFCWDDLLCYVKSYSFMKHSFNRALLLIEEQLNQSLLSADNKNGRQVWLYLVNHYGYTDGKGKDKKTVAPGDLEAVRFIKMPVKKVVGAPLEGDATTVTGKVDGRKDNVPPKKKKTPGKPGQPRRKDTPTKELRRRANAKLKDNPKLIQFSLDNEEKVQITNTAKKKRFW